LIAKEARKMNIGPVTRVTIAPRPRKRQEDPLPTPAVPEPVVATADTDQPVLVTA
jgi:hypothetical protein